MNHVEGAKIKTEIHIVIYEPVNDIPETHKPQISFEGDVLRMKELDQVNFIMRKELRRYKMTTGKELLESETERDEQTKGEISDDRPD
jgi:hypothetical protein